MAEKGGYTCILNEASDGGVELSVKVIELKKLSIEMCCNSMGNT